MLIHIYSLHCIFTILFWINASICGIRNAFEENIVVHDFNFVSLNVAINEFKITEKRLHAMNFIKKLFK